MSCGWQWWCLLVLGVAGCSESLLGYDFPCKKDDDCASGYACSASTARCALSSLSTGGGSDGTDGSADATDGTDGSADATDGTDGASSGGTLDQTEVTVSAYAMCDDPGCTAPVIGTWCNWGVAGREQHPVNCVDWYQATAYCAWSGGRLPTEAEWEFAATNAGTTTEPWGSGAATCSVAIMNDGSGTDGCGQDRTWPVCSKPAGNTKAGHCDLAGNVWEWTSTESGSIRVFRGGGWLFDSSGVGAAARLVFAPSGRDSNLGFRCLRD
jgi:hypothetical protein